MFRNFFILIGIIIFVTGCASIRTNYEFYGPILSDVQAGNFNEAAEKIKLAEINSEYADKDRVMLHLDKGIIFHYQDNYEESNKEFEAAEDAIEELYTKSISKGVFSFLLNDNSLAYDGEVYEDLYINIFKALNYLHLNDFDGAYVETRRIKNKLKELDVKLDQQINQFNSSNDSKFKISSVNLDYYNNVLANYLSFLIFRAESEFDNSRISLEKLNEAWDTYPSVYNFNKPKAVLDSNISSSVVLNVISFTGAGPVKEPIGARITTFDDYIIISDPTSFHIQPIVIPGIKYGWNFKFEFPQLLTYSSAISRISVYANGNKLGDLELLENMNNVATKTFEADKNIIYFKTLTRALLKGIGTSALGRTIKKETNGGFLGDILTGIANAAMDATENADLRSWRTMPGYCYAGEFNIEEGIYNIDIKFYDNLNNEVLVTSYTDYKVRRGLNLLESFYLD